MLQKYIDPKIQFQMNKFLGESNDYQNYPSMIFQEILGYELSGNTEKSGRIPCSCHHPP